MIEHQTKHQFSFSYIRQQHQTDAMIGHDQTLTSEWATGLIRPQIYEKSTAPSHATGA
jgi:hypothetical protein